MVALVQPLRWPGPRLPAGADADRVGGHDSGDREPVGELERLAQYDEA